MTYCLNPMAGYGYNRTKTDVFVRLQFFGISAIRVPSGVFGISCSVLSGVHEYSASLGGSWEQVGILMDFGILPGASQLGSTRSSGAKPVIRGGLPVTSLSPAGQPQTANSSNQDWTRTGYQR